MVLRDRIAVVTGASRGIGRGIAVQLAQEGAKVVLASRSEGDLQTVSDEIGSFGGKAIVVRTDVSKVRDVQNLMAKCSETYGPPDILVNNAGAIARATVHQMDVAEWDEVIAVNQRGTFLCTKYALGGMLEKKKVISS